MPAIIKIAWRNVWRNKLRSITIILSLVLGIWSGLSIMSFAYGMNEQRLRTAINTYLSHVQIQDSVFLEDQGIKHTIAKRAELQLALDSDSLVKGWTARNVLSGMASTANGSYAAQVKGIDPEQEATVTTIGDMLVDGTFFTKYKANPIVIGQKLADKLGVKVKNKVIFNYMNHDGYSVSTNFKVEGIYKTGNSMNDLLTIYAKKSDIDRLGALNGEIHEILIVANSIEDSDSLKSALLNVPGGNEIRTWAEVSPELGYADEVMGMYIYIFMGIILLALAFGVINTMLMAVLERKRELGMLLAVGMNRWKVFRMFIYETIFFSMVATPVGMLLSYLTIRKFSSSGIDLSIVGEGMESFGMASVIYPYLESQYYFTITIMILIVAFMASLVPAYRAMRTVPAEAVKAI
jgi:putative ABC transport system permease protein